MSGGVSVCAFGPRFFNGDAAEMGDRRIAWFGLGVAAAWLVAALAGPAHAQQARPGVRSNAASSAGALRPTVDPFSQSSPADDTSSRADGDDFGDPDQQTDGNDPDATGVAGQRRVPLDGDLSFPVEPTAPVDGLADGSEPAVVQDGVDNPETDTRSDADRAAFETPPAGYNPQLFQIEDLNPITDNRRTAQLFNADPFEPVGIRIGSFVLFPELEFGGSAYSNVFLSPDAQSDVAFDLRPSVRLVSNWARHALEFRSTGTFSWYSDFDTENDESYLVEARGRLDVTRRTNVQALVSRNQELESRSALNASSVGTRIRLTSDRAEGTFNHRFNRLSVQLRGGVSDFAFGPSQNLGVVSNNSDRDYTRTDQALRASWEFKPTFSVFGEVGIDQRNYDTATLSDGINRSSDGQRYRAGISFGNTGQFLRGEIGIGYGVQRPDDAQLGDTDGFLIDANATWRPTELTSLLFTAQSDISETTTANIGGSFFRSLGVEVRHQLRRYLIASAGLTYSTQNSEDGVIDESEVRTTLGVEYFLNSDVVLFSRYAHANFNAVGTTSDYESDEIHVGMRLRR